MIESYKFRLYPTKEQEVLLAKHFGSVRFVYNWALDYSQQQYKTNGKYLGWMSIATSPELKQLKLKNEWLKEINSQSICNSMAHLGKAFDKFFRHQGGFPKHKSKYDSHQSFEVPSGLKLDFKHKKIQIPKFLNKKNEDNRLKCIFSRKVKQGKIGTATVSKNPSGEYYISFIVHTDEQPKEFSKKITKENSLGIDFGLKHFLTFSNGSKIDSPEYFKQSLKRLAKEQHRLSRKRKGSNNRNKQRIKVAKVHQHIKNQRQDFLHKLSSKLVKDSQFDVFCMENLDLQSMMKRWGRKVSDLSYYDFQRMMEYKSIKSGKKIIKIGRFEPSSQICSCCGHRQRMPLTERTYACPECGLSLDRDINAAINIRDFAIFKDSQNTDGTSGINACGLANDAHDESQTSSKVEARKSLATIAKISTVFNR